MKRINGKNLLIIIIISIQTCSIFRTQKDCKYLISLKIEDQISFDEPDFIYRDFGTFFFTNRAIYFADGIYQKIYVFDCSGKYLHSLGDLGWETGKLNAITDIVELTNHHIIVIDGIAQRITEFNSNGDFVQILIDLMTLPSKFLPYTGLKSHIPQRSSHNIAQVYKYMPFFISPYCDAQLIDNKTLILSCSEQFYYYGGLSAKMTLFRKYTFPEFEEISKGGHPSKIYHRKIKALQEYHSLPIDKKLYYIEANAPFITVLDEDLNILDFIHHPESKFKPIKEDFHENLFKETDLYSLFEYVYGISQMKSIFQHRNYVGTMYKNVYSFENFFKSLYKNHYYIFQNFADSLDYSQFEDKDDEYFCQVYSRDLKIFYGEISLPTKPLGFDSKFIYLPGSKSNILHRNTILKCRLEVKPIK